MLKFKPKPENLIRIVLNDKLYQKSENLINMLIEDLKKQSIKDNAKYISNCLLYFNNEIIKKQSKSFEWGTLFRAFTRIKDIAKRSATYQSAKENHTRLSKFLKYFSFIASLCVWYLVPNSLFNLFNIFAKKNPLNPDFLRSMFGNILTGFGLGIHGRQNMNASFGRYKNFVLNDENVLNICEIIENNLENLKIYYLKKHEKLNKLRHAKVSLKDKEFEVYVGNNYEKTFNFMMEKEKNNLVLDQNYIVPPNSQDKPKYK